MIPEVIDRSTVEVRPLAPEACQRQIAHSPSACDRSTVPVRPLRSRAAPKGRTERAVHSRRGRPEVPLGAGSAIERKRGRRRRPRAPIIP